MREIKKDKSCLCHIFSHVLSVFFNLCKVLVMTALLKNILLLLLEFVIPCVCPLFVICHNVSVVLISMHWGLRQKLELSGFSTTPK